MSIEKCRSIVLSTMPYRETSLLLYLFSREHGRLHAIAKGIRKPDKRGVPIERGYVIEHLVYLGRQRDLHQITDCQLYDHFPAIRGDIEKTAARDVLFDVLLAAIKDTDPHPELYAYLERFLRGIDGFREGGGVPLLLHLSKCVFGIAAHLGFGVDFAACAKCRKTIGEITDNAVLSLVEGTMRCTSCRSARMSGADRLLPQAAVLYFSSTDEFPVQELCLTVSESLRLLHCATDYCRYHADVQKKFASIGFIDTLFGRAVL